jgi:hypothetical protein
MTVLRRDHRFSLRPYARMDNYAVRTSGTLRKPRMCIFGNFVFQFSSPPISGSVSKTPVFVELSPIHRHSPRNPPRKQKSFRSTPCFHRRARDIRVLMPCRIRSGERQRSRRVALLGTTDLASCREEKRLLVHCVPCLPGECSSQCVRERRGDSLHTLQALCVMTGLITPRSSKSASALRANEPLIFSLSTRTATVTRR